jgi:nucleoside-diphosphate-sugar epimerase
MTDVLITGCSGLIGRPLEEKLKAAKYDTLGINSQFGSVSDRVVWNSLPPCKTLIHLAAKTYVPDSWDDPVEFHRTNYIGTLLALEYCRKYNARLIYLSSYMYGNSGNKPISEVMPLEANNPYALSKLMSEKACKFYEKTFGLKIIIFRPFNIYGEFQKSTYLIPNIVNQINQKSVIEVNDLEPKRDYIYVEDIVNAIFLTVQNEMITGTFNLGTGQSHSVNDVISIIQNILGTSLPVNSRAARRPGEIMDSVADISRINDCIGWHPKYSLRRGLSKFLKTR